MILIAHDHTYIQPQLSVLQQVLETLEQPYKKRMELEEKNKLS